MSIDDLLRFRGGELPAGDVAPLSKHLFTCAECNALAREMFAKELEELGRALGEREAGRSRRAMPIAVLAAAAAIVIAVALALLLRPPAGTPPIARRPPPRTPSPWEAVKAQALRAGSIGAPALSAAVRVLPDEQARGSEGDAPAVVLEPNGVVIDETRPRFRWRGAASAMAVVSVFADGNLVVRSPPVPGTSWTPERDLGRGVVYQWQLDVKKGGRTYTVPAAPHRPPSFAIVDEASHRRLIEARRSAPGDHLLFGIVAAQAGLQREALEELDRHLAAHPGDAAARSLAASVRRWSRGNAVP